MNPTKRRYLSRCRDWSSAVLDAFFRWFETRVDPFPPEQPARPPEGVLRFVWFYTRPFIWLLVVSIVLSAVIAFVEVYLFSFLGKLVDLLTKADRASFWQTNGLCPALVARATPRASPAMSPNRRRSSQG